MASGSERAALPDIAQLARERDPDIQVDHLVVETEQSIALWRPSWLPARATGKQPIPQAMVAIGWWKTVRFDATNAPWVGLRMGSSRDTQLRQSLRQLVEEQAIGKQAFPSGKPAGKGVWVRFRQVPVPTERYWEDLVPYRAALVNAVSEAWRDFADVIDTALQNTS